MKICFWFWFCIVLIDGWVRREKKRMKVENVTPQMDITR